MNDTTTNTIETIRDIVRTTRRVVAETPMDDADAVDIAGELRATARAITDMARTVESEIADDATIAGSRWQTKTSRSAKRTYNETAILRTLSTVYGTTNVGDVIHAAVNDGAAKLVWSWSGLRKTFDVLNAPLTIVPHEIADGDIEPDDTMPHVGEVWTTKTSIEAVTE